MTDQTSAVMALGDIAELLAERDAAHLFAGLVAVLEPHVELEDHEPVAAPVLPVDAILWLIRLLDRDVDLHTGTTLAKLLETVRPYLLGVPTPEPVEIPLGDGSGEALSAREVTVLALMASGKSNRDIGKVLFLSENTIKTHIRRIFPKLGVLTRAHAVASAYELGLLTPRATGRRAAA